MKLCVAKTRFRIFEIKFVLALLADLANLCVKEPDRVCVNCVKDPDRVCVKDPDLDCKNKSPSKAIVSLGWLLSVRFKYKPDYKSSDLTAFTLESKSCK